MRDIAWYVDKAKEYSGATSDRKICEMLGMAENATHAWRKKNVLPSDETMMKLAKIAGIDPYIALLDLNMWRSDGEAKKAYASMLKKITAAFVALIIAFSFNNPALAKSDDFNEYGRSVNIIETIHYHIRISGLLSSLCGSPRDWVMCFYCISRHSLWAFIWGLFLFKVLP